MQASLDLEDPVDTSSEDAEEEGDEMEEYELGTRAQNLLDRKGIASMLKQERSNTDPTLVCCQNKCTGRKHFTEEFVYEERKKTLSGNSNVTRRIALAAYRGVADHAKSVHRRGDMSKSAIFIGTNKVCAKAFQRLLGMSVNLWVSVCDCALGGPAEEMHKSSQLRASPKQETVIEFFVEHIVERTETLRQSTTPIYLLPGFTQWEDLYTFYVKWCQARSIPKERIASRKYFLELRKGKYPELRLD